MPEPERERTGWAYVSAHTEMPSTVAVCVSWWWLLRADIAHVAVELGPSPDGMSVSSSALRPRR